MCLKGVYVEKAEWSLGESLACRDQEENKGKMKMRRRWHAGQRSRGEGGGGGGEGGGGGVGGRGNGLQEVGEAAASIPGLPVCPVTNSCPYPSVPGSFSLREGAGMLVLTCTLIQFNARSVW